MDRRADGHAQGSLQAADAMLRDLNSDQANALIAASADVALVLDGDGTILEASISSEDLMEFGFEEWPGQSWFDVVTSENHAKLKILLSPTDGAQTRWRQVTHPTKLGTELPIRYISLKLKDDRILVVGRSMQAVATLQQELVQSQLSMEREYARIRHAETRYRLLFQLVGEAIVIVDAATHKVLEMNPAAARILNQEEKRLIGTSINAAFDAESRAAVQSLMNQVREGARDETITLPGQNERPRMSVSGSLFRQEGMPFFLLRFTQPLDSKGAEVNSTLMSKLIAATPEGIVITDMTGNIIRANDAFLDMAQIGSEEQIKGHAIGRWLGRSAVDYNVLMANLREHGVVRLFTTGLRNEFGGSQDVEISAVRVSEDALSNVGFVVRRLEDRVSMNEAQAPSPLARSVDQLSHLVGRVPLKDLVQESTDIIERLCIEAALDLTGDNRASAAEMLGLSRQSLYVKLRRYGMGQRDTAQPETST